MRIIKGALAQATLTIRMVFIYWTVYRLTLPYGIGFGRLTCHRKALDEYFPLVPLSEAGGKFPIIHPATMDLYCFIPPIWQTAPSSYV